MRDPAQLYGQPWKEPEYVIALHSYFANRSSPRHSEADFVQEVAGLLGRTPASVVMRLENFASLDADAGLSRKGLSNGGPICREVFLRWKDQPDNLRSCAEMLIRELKQPRTYSLFEPERVIVPKAFEKYELLDLIGRGGFGSVFSCVEIETGRPYALKIINMENRFDSEAMHRFRREIRILRSVHHDCIIRLHEDNLEKEKSFPAFVMDLAECSLADYLQQKAEERLGERPFISTIEASAIFRSIAAAVDALHCHSPRVIHRDISPKNILLRNGAWVLADFGLAKFVKTAATASAFATKPGPGLATFYYSAPEQYFDFTKTDQRTDIYALGMILWDLFTKGLPPPDTAKPDLPKGLAEVFVKAASRDHQARYENVSEMMAAFDTLSA